jgi:hypothetical protein
MPAIGYRAPPPPHPDCVQKYQSMDRACDELTRQVDAALSRQASSAKAIVVGEQKIMRQNSAVSVTVEGVLNKLHKPRQGGIK